MPLFTPGHDVAVLVAEPVIPNPVVTVTVLLPVQPLISLIATVCVPAATPVKILPACVGPPSKEYV